MSTYRETLTEHQVIEVEIVVDDAPSEQVARDLATQYEGLDGRYYDRSTGCTVEITRTVQDSDTESNDDGEWEDDEDSDEYDIDRGELAEW